MRHIYSNVINILLVNKENLIACAFFMLPRSKQQISWCGIQVSCLLYYSSKIIVWWKCYILGLAQSLELCLKAHSSVVSLHVRLWALNLTNKEQMHCTEFHRFCKSKQSTCMDTQSTIHIPLSDRQDWHTLSLIMDVLLSVHWGTGLCVFTAITAPLLRPSPLNPDALRPTSQ